VFTLCWPWSHIMIPLRYRLTVALAIVAIPGLRESVRYILSDPRRFTHCTEVAQAWLRQN
jgi:hypothetical protein